MIVYRSLLLRGWPVFLLLFLGVGGYCGFRARHLTIDAGTNMLLNENDPDLYYYNQSRADWEYDEYTILCVHREDWFTRAAIDDLKRLTDELRTLPHVEKVDSIATVPLLRVQPPVRTRFGDAPSKVQLTEAGCDLALARAELLDHTQAKGNLISADGKNLSILVYLRISDEIRKLEPRWNYLHGRPDDPEAKKEIERIRGPYDRALAELRRQRTEQVAAVRQLARRWAPAFDEPIRLSGIPIVNVNLVEHVGADLRNFGLAALAMFVLGFAVVFRKIRWTALPILTCVLPVAIVLGSMVILDRKLTVITSNMPVLLFILMLPYTVYFIERYRERRNLYPTEDPRTTVPESARGIWIPCLYSATTTMAGTASLLTSGVSPVRTFGIMMTVGIALGLAAVFLFLPSATRPLPPLAVRPLRTRGPLHLLAGVPLAAPRTVVLLSLAILGVAIWGTTKLDPETKFIDYFRKDSEIYAGLEYIDQRVGGTTPLEVVLRSEEKGYFRTPEGLAAIASAQAYFDPASMRELGNMRSLRTLVDEGRKWVEKYGIKKWDDPRILKALLMIAKRLVREFCNEDFTVTRILVRMKETEPKLNRKRILDGLDAHLRQGPKLAEKRPTGIFVLYSNMLQSLLKSQRDTLALVIGVIFVMLVILFRSPLMAILVLLPQVLPVFVVLGTMGFAGIPLDMVTTMIASVAMGVGIDPAIQYAVRFRKERAFAATHEEAVRRTHETIGRAIAIGGVIVFAGFGVLALSKFVPTMRFGLLTGLAILMGIVAALTTLPATFVLLRYPRP